MVYIKRFGILLLTFALQYPVFAQVSNSAVNRINDLETGFYGRAFVQEDLYKRIARLENSVFGKASFDSTHDRLDRLERSLGRGNSLKSETPARSISSKTSPLSSGRSSDQKFADLLTRAQANISLKRFNVAADELMSAIEINSTSSLAFRQLGDVLMELRDVEGAQEAYKACVELDQAGENGKYAKAKLQVRSSRSVRAMPRAPYIPAKPIDALSKMNAQINDYASKVNKEGQQGANWRAQSTGREIEKIRQDTEQWARDSQTYSTSGGMPFGGSRSGRSSGGGVWTSTSSSSSSSSRSSRNGGIVEQGRLRSNFVNADGQTQTNNALNEAAERARNFTESAENLRDQLAKKKRKGDPDLKEFGTNVYIRYYGSDSASRREQKPPEDPALELKAKPQSMK